MKNKKNIVTSTSSKGAAVFKKMMEDKKAIREHIQKGGKIADIKRKSSILLSPYPSHENENFHWR